MNTSEFQLEDGETIIWSGAPNYNRAAPQRGNSRLAAWFWLVGILAAISAMIFLGMSSRLSEFVEGLFGAFVVILAVVAVTMLIALVAGKWNPRPAERYVLTNLRLLILNDETGDRSSFFADSFIAFDQTSNGSVRNLSVYLAGSDEEYRVLRALDDAAEIESLLIKHGIARRARA